MLCLEQWNGKRGEESRLRVRLDTVYFVKKKKTNTIAR